VVAEEHGALPEKQSMGRSEALGGLSSLNLDLFGASKDGTPQPTTHVVPLQRASPVPQRHVALAAALEHDGASAAEVLGGEHLQADEADGEGDLEG
jgi:hypothetical protein